MIAILEIQIILKENRTTLRRIEMRLHQTMAVATGLLLGSSWAFAAYNIQDRYELINDRLSTDEMLRPLEHDFLLEINAAASLKILDVIDDAKQISKGDDEDAKEEKAKEYLNKYKNNEYSVKVGTNLGAPLFTFYLGKLKIVPDLRVGARGMVNLDVTTQPVTAETVMEFVDESDVRKKINDDALADKVFEYIKEPAVIEQLLNGEIFQKFKDAKYAIDNPTVDPTKDAILDDLKTTYGFEEEQIEKVAEKVANTEDAEKWTLPLNEDPVLSAYTRLDVKAGLNINYFYDDWFGNLSLYGFHRTDYLKRLTATSFAKGSKPLDDVKKLNSAIFADLDFKIGHKFGRYSVYGGIEELEITEVQKRKADSVAPHYKSDPLIRIHGEAKFKYGGLSLTPFVGAFKRSFYDVSDGIYAGVDAGAFVWGDRIGLLARAMFDPGYFTLVGQAKIWLIQADLTIKKPIKDPVEGQKVGNLFAANLRISI